MRFSRLGLATSMRLNFDRSIDDMVLRHHVGQANLFFFQDAVLVGERSLSITPLARHLAPKLSNLNSSNVLLTFSRRDNWLQGSLYLFGSTKENGRSTALNALIVIHLVQQRPQECDRWNESAYTIQRSKWRIPLGQEAHRATCYPYIDLQARMRRLNQCERSKIAVLATTRR